MFNRILIPTDGSEEVFPAVETGFEIAQTHSATIHVLYVVKKQQPFAEFGGGVGWWYDLMEQFEKEGERSTTEIAAQANNIGINTKTAIRRGIPQNTILVYADEHDIDLIVMGTHGRTGVTRALMGSVTETVVRHADIPVLTVSRDTGMRLEN
ncbi:universal stress protein [Haladaptatus halobius]|uniref:universal stress protein n=1 Tax=Haladaptatus halobius TaxID=2884875 RepID=UPI001D0B61FF|nr:universal stress protein [Haladaptatus halobius]